MKKMAKAMYGKIMKMGGKATAKKMGMGGMQMMPDGTMMKNSEMKIGGAKKSKMMVGGVVNSNAKVSADKTPGSKGTKVGLNKKINKPKK